MILPAQTHHQHRRHCLPTFRTMLSSVELFFSVMQLIFPEFIPDQCTRGGWLRSSEQAARTLIQRKGWLTLPHAKNPAPDMPDPAGRYEYQLLHHGLDAPALGALAHRRIEVVQSVLSNQTHQVHRRCGLACAGKCDLQRIWGAPLMLAMIALVIWMPNLSSKGATIATLILVATQATLAVLVLLWKNPAALRLLNVQLPQN